MKLDYSPHFLRSYDKTPKKIQRAFDKQSALLVNNLRHPSLRAKKYSERANIWQVRVTGSWRFYFAISADTYQMLEISPHPQ